MTHGHYFSISFRFLETYTYTTEFKSVSECRVIPCMFLDLRMRLFVRYLCLFLLRICIFNNTSVTVIVQVFGYPTYIFIKY